MSGFPRRSRFSLVLLGAAAAAFLAAAAFASAQFLPIPGGGGRIGDAVSPAASPAATVKPAADTPVSAQDKAKPDTKPRDESSNPPGSSDVTVTCDNPGFDWTKNPKVATLGKFGFFPIAPTHFVATMKSLRLPFIHLPMISSVLPAVSIPPPSG